ncbi:MAG TPA: hypothetical protein VKZ50_04075 [bacterium]|nr:hypothetical protein [bacterium]
MVHGTLERPDPEALTEALRVADVRDRMIALAVPTRDVRIGMLAKGLVGARARRAATLAAAQQLRIDPAVVAVSLDHHGSEGTAYVAAPTDTVAKWVAPWSADRWRVSVVEPAGTALLREAGRDTVELFVRTGAGTLDVVVGSRTRWVLARTVDLDWEHNLPSARVEVEDTITLVRKVGVELGGLVVGGAGAAGILADALSTLGTIRPLMVGAGLDADLPPEALVAASVAQWDRQRRSQKGLGWSDRMPGLTRLWRRRRSNAA